MEKGQNRVRKGLTAIYLFPKFGNKDLGKRGSAIFLRWIEEKAILEKLIYELLRASEF